MEKIDNSKDRITSCITDQPSQTIEDDKLGASEYAAALSQFIINADTPVTIGIQGGWGSGKTSLISLLKENLENDEECQKKSLCIIVNAWEHSLFQNADNKAEVALSLLNGLSEGVREKIEEEGSHWLDPSARDYIQSNGDNVRKAIEGLKVGIKFVGKVAVQMASNMVGGGNIDNVTLKTDKNQPPVIAPLAKYARELKKELKEMISRITFHDNPVKVIFFIDDLDRVPPSTAVEILDITKNIFDIQNCIFVIAVDYEVVVKGLASKYGRKTELNEREFRQYFDKIIQIPFTMPLGAYSDKLEEMLAPALKQIGKSITQVSPTTLKYLANDAKLATGGIPRSIKRILNTLSLLQYIAKAKNKEGNSQIDAEKLDQELEIRFIIVAMHINFPEICKRLMEKPNYTMWRLETLDIPWKLNVSKNQANLLILETEEIFNDEWEKVVYCLTAHNPWLRTNAANISLLLNRLLVVLDPHNDPSEPLSDNSIETLQSILSDMKVVTVDTEIISDTKIDDKNIKDDRVTNFFILLQNMIADKIPDGIVPVHTTEYAKRINQRSYKINLNSDIYQAIEFNYDKNDEIVFIGFNVNKEKSTKKHTKEIIEKLYPEEYQYNILDQKTFELYFSESMSWDDFLIKDNQININAISDLSNKTLKLFYAVNEILKSFNKT